MAEAVGALHVGLSAGFAQFKKDLGKAGNAAQQFGRGLVNIGKTAALGLAAVTTATVAVGAGLVALTKSVADAGDRFAKMSAKTGESTEFLSAFAHAADLSGVSTEQMETSIARLARTMSDASNGLTTAQRSFRQLGIQVQNTDGTLRPTREVILEVADRFAGMTDATKKAALAQELFGRAGVQLLPLLNQGSAAIREQMQEAERLGIVCDQKAAAAAERFNDEMSRMGKALTGIKIIIGQALMPAMTALVTRTKEWVIQNKDFLKAKLPEALGAIVRALAQILTLHVKLRVKALELNETWLKVRETIELSGLLFPQGGEQLAKTIDEQVQNTLALQEAKQDLARAEKFAAGAAKAFVQGQEASTSAAKAQLAQFSALTKETAKAGKQQDEMVKDFERFQVLTGQSIVDNAKLNFEIGEKRAEANEQAIQSLKDLQQELKLAGATELAQKIHAIEQEHEARIKAIDASLKTQKEFVRETITDQDFLASEITRINQEGAVAIGLAYDDLRKKLDTLFAANKDAAKAMEREISLELLSESDRRLEIIDRELLARHDAIRKMGLEHEDAERLMTLATEAAEAKRREATGQTVDFQKEAAKTITGAFTTAWGNLVSSFSNSVARIAVEGGKLTDFFKQTAIAILQSAITLGLQLVTIWATTEASRAATTQAANATIAASNAATAGITASSIAAMTASVGASIAAAASNTIKALLALWTVAKAVLSSIAAAMKATIFGIPVGLLITAALVAGAIAVNQASKEASVALGALAVGTFALTFLQHGGIVTEPTLAMIGEGGPEAVIPLGGHSVLGGGGLLDREKPTHIHLHIGPREVAEAVIPEMPGIIRRKLGNRM